MSLELVAPGKARAIPNFGRFQLSAFTFAFMIHVIT